MISMGGTGRDNFDIHIFDLKSIIDTVQINFHLSPEDERNLLDYIFERSGYFVAYDGAGKSHYETFFSELPKYGANKYKYNNLMLFQMEYAPIKFEKKSSVFSRFKNPGKHPLSQLVRNSEFFDETGFKKEFIEYSRCIVNGDTLHWGRLWMNGLESEPTKFYRNICSYIRKICTKEQKWHWIGQNVPDYLRENKMRLGQAFSGSGVQ